MRQNLRLENTAWRRSNAGIARLSGTVAFAFALVLALTIPGTASAQNPFSIDGIVTDASNSGIPGATKGADPDGNNKELGPINSSSTKIGVINSAVPPMLGFTNPNAQVDLNAVWTQTAVAADGHIWFYFGWRRDSNSGSGFLSIEMQQSPLPAECNYAGVDQTSSTSSAALIANCNPWKNRQAGDFLILWDQSGNSTQIYKRVFSGTAPNLVLGSPVLLGTAVAEFSADNFAGEAAIDMTVDVFPPNSGCISFANTIPSTVTGNSDTADYKDTVLAAFPPISNCGSIQVSKVTQDPSGTEFAGTGTFPYTIARADNSNLRFAADAVNYPDDTLTTISRTLTHDGDSNTHPDLIEGTNYTLSEDTKTMGPQWSLVSIVCTVPGDSTQYPGTGFPVSVNKVTSCVITNRFVKASPAGTTQQWVKLFDKITITGVNTSSGSPASSVTFRLYADAGCSTQVGNDITAALSYTGTTATADTSASGGVVVNAGGTFYWRVTYPGDAFNNGFTTTCGSESTQVAFVQ